MVQLLINMCIISNYIVLFYFDELVAILLLQCIEVCEKVRKNLGLRWVSNLSPFHFQQQTHTRRIQSLYSTSASPPIGRNPSNQETSSHLRQQVSKSRNGLATWSCQALKLSKPRSSLKYFTHLFITSDLSTTNFPDRRLLSSGALS